MALVQLRICDKSLLAGRIVPAVGFYHTGEMGEIRVDVCDFFLKQMSEAEGVITPEYFESGFVGDLDFQEDVLGRKVKVMGIEALFGAERPEEVFGNASDV